MKNNSHAILGNISNDEFLAQYWQKKPLLIKAALPNFQSPLTPDELAGLALEPDIESRIVTGSTASNTWSVKHGPFDENLFTTLPDKDWTLLVQGVDLWVPEVRDLIDYFDFLPRWRIDDIMASYATPGGSVGPHFDYYDVFLLQGAGQREWKIGASCDESSPLLSNTDLKILQQFEETQSWILEPGDMLYLPPTIAHHGIARSDDCITYSVGFRSPTAVEMLNDLALELMSRNDLATTHLTDPALNSSNINDELPTAYIDQLKELLSKTLNNTALLEDWFANYMTRPKQQDADEASELSKQQITAAIKTGRIREILPNARIMKTSTGTYIDGEKI